MFDKLFDLVIQFIGLFRFYVVVDCFQRAVILRWGQFKRELAPGLHFMWPLAEDVYCETVVANTAHLRDQSLITIDSKDVSLSAVITYKIDDVRKFLLEVEGSHAAVTDIAYGALAEWVSQNTLDALRDPKNWRKLATVIRNAGKEYGINIVRVSLSDITRSRTLRLLGDKG